MEIRRGACGFLSTDELEAEAVGILPDRAALSLFGSGLTSIPAPTDLAGLVSDAGAASGSADQTAPIVQGLAGPPTVPI